MSGEVIGVGRTGDRVPSVLQSLGMGFRGVATLDDALVAMRTRPSVLLVASRDALAGEPLDGLRALRAGVAAPAGVMLIVDDAAQAMPFLAERLVDDFVMAAADPAALEARLLAALRKAETGQWLRVLAVAGETMATAKSLDGVFEGIARGLAPVLPLDQFAVAWEEGEDVLFERVVLEGDVVQTHRLAIARAEACGMRFANGGERHRLCAEVRDSRKALAEGMHSCVCLPLGGQPRAALCLASHRPRAFTPAHLPHLESLAVQVAHTVANIQRYQQAKTEADRLAVIVREVHHRIKNNLQGVIGLLGRHREDHPQAGPVLTRAIGQLYAIAEVHNLLSRQTRETVGLNALIEGVCRVARALSPHQIQSLPTEATAKLCVPASEAVPIALILNELIQNATNHGYPDNRLGTVRVLHLRARAPAASASTWCAPSCRPRARAFACTERESGRWGRWHGTSKGSCARSLDSHAPCSSLTISCRHAHLTACSLPGTCLAADSASAAWPTARHAASDGRQQSLLSAPIEPTSCSNAIARRFRRCCSAFNHATSFNPRTGTAQGKARTVALHRNACLGVGGVAMLGESVPAHGISQGEEERNFNPDHYVVGLLRRAVANRQDVRIHGGDLGEIILFPARGEFFASGDVPTLCQAPADRFRVSCLGAAKTEAIARQHGIGRNLDELMWQAGYYASNGRLMEGCFRDDVVQLRHWPNLTRLPAPASAMRVAALLTRYPTSIGFAGRLLKVPRTEMYAFYSAARCAGLAIAINRKPVEPVLKPHRNQPLLGLLLNKIAGL
ncbi:hypothetical protein SVA_1836 [Sulfurifustis variabilis]|uniref:histidine kinase n=2 Tax=Sulfurifustis variabilis TaxID=1675686 RepID=A0A1B4V4E4_9GAMM|nr:hypothetical protein SVA_1836 [Sulfurifustis variabilis]